MNYKKIVYPVVLVLAFFVVFGLGTWVGATQIAYSVPQPNNVDFSLFWDAYNRLQEKFIDPSKITNEKIVFGAIEGMTAALGDPYTSFMEPSKAQRFQQDLSGSFDGIGVSIGVKKDLTTHLQRLNY